MKILLDESVPRKLKDDFGTEHEVWVDGTRQTVVGTEERRFAQIID